MGRDGAGLDVFVVEVELLLAGYRAAVLQGGGPFPLLDGRDDELVDTVTDAAGLLQLGYFAVGADDYVEDDVALGAMREDGEIGVGWGEVAGEGEGDVAGTEGVLAVGGVGVG